MGTGTPWPRILLVQAAHAARGRRGTYLGAQQRCLAARRAKGGAAAVGRSVLVNIYYWLRDGTVWHDLGPRSFDERDRQATERRLLRRLEGLGDKVTLGNRRPRDPCHVQTRLYTCAAYAERPTPTVTTEEHQGGYGHVLERGSRQLLCLGPPG